MANLLLIDSDERNRRLLAAYLKAAGHELLTSPFAEHGIAIAMDTHPDLILAEVILPDLTGFQICAVMRQHPQTRNIPIILMSGQACSPNQQQLGKLMGANEFLTKPLDFQAVESSISRLLQIPEPQAAPPPGLTVISSGDPIPETRQLKLERLFAIIRDSINLP